MNPSTNTESIYYRMGVCKCLPCDEGRECWNDEMCGDDGHCTINPSQRYKSNHNQSWKIFSVLPLVQ